MYTTQYFAFSKPFSCFHWTTVRIVCLSGKQLWSSYIHQLDARFQRRINWDMYTGKYVLWIEVYKSSFSSCIHLWCMIAEYVKWIRLGKTKVFITSRYTKLIFQGWSHPDFTAAGVLVSRNKTRIFRILFKKCVVESEWSDCNVARELMIKTYFLVYFATPKKCVFRWSDKSHQLSSSTNSMIFQWWA